MRECTFISWNKHDHRIINTAVRQQCTHLQACVKCMGGHFACRLSPFVLNLMHVLYVAVKYHIVQMTSCHKHFWIHTYAPWKKQTDRILSPRAHVHQTA